MAKLRTKPSEWLKKPAENGEKYIVVIGCGRLGSLLANRTSKAGHSVVVVDTEKRAFEKLATGFSGFRIEGNTTELAVLKKAKLDQADVVFVTTRDDTINLTVAQIASRIFSVPKVVARVFDPEREEIYHTQEIETISPTILAGEEFLSAIQEANTRK
ncbi:MAG: TrkA family potassium uptake protein [Candidatus Marinimicrobia bacterium]|nr:TrkA family potassium uptake protein [Candidatus Neomarinimicrobiota bacterium]MCF7829653.1 TrkA family potassium uptake protein [Candidatus Neomarinimicrobiota bacterium]MCF7879813.1 TrkA family potassium uptake protein [Candidatus Neomarinimicrobiota bacterium]